MVSLASRPSVSSIAILKILIIFTCCHPGTVHANDHGHREKLCPSEAIVDLTHAIKNASGFLADDESGYSFPPWAISNNSDGVLRGCICDIKPCLPLCPPVKGAKVQVAEDFVNLTAIPRVYNTEMTFDDDEETRGPEERFHFLIWNPCPGQDAYFLDPENYPEDEFYLLGNGSLFLPRMNESEVRFMGLETYCLRLRPNHSSYTPKVCSPKYEPQYRIIYRTDDLARVKYIGGLVAVPFLIATVIVYSVLPELRNIHGTTLRCYLCCLIVTFVALAADRIPDSEDLNASAVCLWLGFTIYFSFLASFCWLNIMCFDMWWTFRGSGTLQCNAAKQISKKFMKYSIFAWGIPVILTAICIGMEFSPGIPADSIMSPGFKRNVCWFDDKIAEALFFYGPVSVAIVCNIFFFVSTSMQIALTNKVTQRELNTEDSKCHDTRKQWFNLYLKFFVVMGINWSTEVISWYWEEPKYLWLVTDMANALAGILIFVIFVCKRNVLDSLKKRWNIKTLHAFQCQMQGCICISRNSKNSSSATGVNKE